jgi:transposase
MYLRTLTRKNKDGSVVKYLQLAHNSWDPEKKQSKTHVVYTFGRRDELDIASIQRLVRSLSRLLPPDEASQAQIEAEHQGPVDLLSSRSAGGALVLKGIWKRLRIDKALSQAMKSREFTAPIGDAIFAMVANRALNPSSKLAIEEWANQKVDLDLTQPLQVQHFYRGMDLLLENAELVQKKVFEATASLLNLIVDVVFFDTTNISFETEDPQGSELKAYGKPKEGEKEAPLVTIGLAVTWHGIPIKCWVLPGNQHDATTVESIQKELAGWGLNRVIWVMDRGMTSDENKKYLQRGGGDYILGEKLRGPKASEEALSRGGRYREVAENLQVKEVSVGQGAARKRYVISYNPEEAAKDQAARQQILDRISAEMERINELPQDKRATARKRLLKHKTLGRYVKELRNGSLRIDQAKVKDDAKLDGKHLISSSNDELSADELAQGYKQLLEVERSFRTMKTTLDLRPVYHSKDERIRSHVLLCWLSLLLIRIIERETKRSWPKIRSEMERLHLVEFLAESRRIFQYTKLSNDQHSILKKLKIKPPKMIKAIEQAA